MRKAECKVDLRSEIDISVRDGLEMSVTHLRGDDTEEAVERVNEELSWQVCTVTAYGWY